MPWDHTEVFWVDERRLPWEDPESNFGAARPLLGLPESRLHPMDTAAPAERAARSYESELRRLCPDGLDLAVLGLGADGHTASLFPGTPAPPAGRWVAAVPAAGSPKVERVTLTFEALAAARTALFLAARAGKERAVDEVLGPETSGLPAAQVRPREELLWFVSER